MNDVIALLKQHRSIRRFKKQALDDGMLEHIVQAGQSASTSSFIQATTVVRVTKQELKEQFVELSGGQKYISSAAEFLVFCADLNRNKQRIEHIGEGDADYSWTEQFIAASVDVALFAQNSVIAAESLGLGCCYIGGIRNKPELVTELLSLPQLVYPVFGLCVGFPDQEPLPKPRLPTGAVLHENAYVSANKHELLLDEYDEHIKQYYINRSKGRLEHTWSEQMYTQSLNQTRPRIRNSLNDKGFAVK